MKHARQDYNKTIVDLASKIPEDEPVFLIRGQDISGPATLRFWARRHIENGGDEELAHTVQGWALEMEKWQKNHNCKIADIPNKNSKIT